MEKLISMTDFVLNEKWKNSGMTRSDIEIKLHSFSSIIKYAKFLKKHLTLGMFIPCDLDGNVLEEPRREYYDSMTGWNCPEDAEKYHDKLSEYYAAKKRVLFEGLKIIDKGSFYFIEQENSCIYFRILKRSEGTIEFLLKNGWEIQLTEIAKKLIS